MMDSNVIIITWTIGFLTFAVIVIYLIISHQRKLWNEQNKLQRKLMKAVIETQEKERERIAQDLHDEIGALAVSLKVNNDAIRDHANNPEVLEEIRHKNEMLANEIIKTGRQVSHDLLPPVIKRSGLIEALTVLTENLSTPSKTKISFNCEEKEIDMDSIAEISIYRALKEWIHNVIRHAEATELEVSLFVENDILKILSSDNGKNFNFKETKKKSKGLGLMNIEGRLNQLNARYDFFNNGDKGTTLSIEYALNTNGSKT